MLAAPAEHVAEGGASAASTDLGGAPTKRRGAGASPEAAEG